MIISRNPDGSIGIMATLQVDALILMVYPDGNIPETWNPMLVTWNAEANNHAEKYDIDEYSRATGLMTWIVRARIDVQPAYARIASRTHQCTTKDWDAVKYVTAYLHLTRKLMLNYHKRGKYDGEANISGAADASYRHHSDGSAHLAGGT
jgi:hypothetical protein